MKIDLHKIILEMSQKVVDTAGREVRILKDHMAVEIAYQHQIRLCEIYTEALKVGVYPYRYIRNIDVISITEQIKLAESRVAVIGAGGLGGQVILLLTRIGIGHLIIVDHDVFDETNLNRQPLCSKETLGKSKSLIAADVVVSINPGVEVTPYQISITPSNIDEILKGSHVAVDALDNVHDRLFLQAATKRLGIPLIHGAVAGFGGRIMTIYPGDQGLTQLYGSEVKGWDDTGNAENFIGVPVITPTIIASLQAMEVIKILLQRGKIFRNVMAYFDLESSEFDKFTF